MADNRPEFMADYNPELPEEIKGITEMITSRQNFRLLLEGKTLTKKDEEIDNY